MDNNKSLADPKTRLRIRNATLSDVPAICDLTAKVYADSGMKGYSAGSITGQINIFPKVSLSSRWMTGSSATAQHSSSAVTSR